VIHYGRWWNLQSNKLSTAHTARDSSRKYMSNCRRQTVIVGDIVVVQFGILLSVSRGDVVGRYPLLAVSVGGIFA
jgi:hypothetical protein